MSDKFCINVSGGLKINIELFADKAPITVKNFKQLVADSFYDGLCFHRVIDGFMIQGGGFSIDNGELKQKQAQTIKGEFLSNQVDNDIKHLPGTISMARAMDKNSASSQFFICAANCSYLDGEYAGFGSVIDEDSLNAIISISKAQTGKWMHFDDVPITPIIIESIRQID